MIEDLLIGDFNMDDFLSLEKADAPQINAGSKAIKVIIIIDASNSMKGYKLGAVNDAVNNLIEKLSRMSKSYANSIDVMGIVFSNRVSKWSSEFIPVAAFTYSFIETTGGKSNVTKVLEELTHICQKQLVGEEQNVMLFFTDGLPTVEYEAELACLNENNTFKTAKRYCISFEEDIQDELSMEFFNAFSNNEPIPINEVDLICESIF